MERAFALRRSALWGILGLVLLCTNVAGQSVRRRDQGDLVFTSEASTSYCSQIGGYCDWSTGSCASCICNFRRTYTSSTCEEYYTVCPIRFSRSSLNSDTSVSTLEFTNGGAGIVATASGDSRRLVRSTSESNLSPNGGCTIDRFEILRGADWQELNSGGFQLAQRGTETHLEIDGGLAVPYETLTGDLLRLNITCPGYSGCLPFKIAGESDGYNMCGESGDSGNDGGICVNGGTCRSDASDGNGFCTCPSGFGGDYCQTETACLADYCHHGGVCVDTGSGDPTCECATGFNGDRCETNIDDCSPNPCQNGGTCVDGVNSYICRCAAGFTGTACTETDAGNVCTGSDCYHYVVRRDIGDVVYTNMVSVSYCSSIGGYCNPPCTEACFCNFRRTYSSMTGRCEEYYTVCPIRFSRASLSSDTSVTTLEFTADGTILGIQAVLTSSSRRLVRSTSESNLSPSGSCSIQSFEILHGSNWQGLDRTGFELSQQGQETHLTVTNDLAVPYELLDGEFLRLNITCPGYSGCLPFKIGGGSNQTTDFNICSSDGEEQYYCTNGGICRSSRRSDSDDDDDDRRCESPAGLTGDYRETSSSNDCSSYICQVYLIVFLLVLYLSIL